MGEQRRPATRSKAAEQLVLRTIAAHADSLLRAARRHSICDDDAQDAYQRGLEIFMRNAERLDAGRAPAWLHTVVKNEALAIRRSRVRLVGVEPIDPDAHEARGLPTSDERLLTFDMVSRSAEALQRLKPQELRALWLRAQGHSYGEIAAMTGWSYTKVNRCLTEGRRSFLQRYAGIESGDECRSWKPVISALVDGEATQQQILELRPHLRNCPGCRATLRALQDSSAPIAAVLPVPLVVSATLGSNTLPDALMRAYEALTGGVHERLVTSMTKAQAVLEAAPAAKVAAVAASAAAVAGGGYATVDQATRTLSQRSHPARVGGSAAAHRAAGGSRSGVAHASVGSARAGARGALVAGAPRRVTRVTREFGLEGGGAPVANAASSGHAGVVVATQPTRRVAAPAPKLAPAQAAGAVDAEFGP